MHLCLLLEFILKYKAQKEHLKAINIGLKSGEHLGKLLFDMVVCVFASLLVLQQYSSYKSSYLRGRDMRPLN